MITIQNQDHRLLFITIQSLTFRIRVRGYCGLTYNHSPLGLESEVTVD